MVTSNLSGTITSSFSTILESFNTDPSKLTLLAMLRSLSGYSLTDSDSFILCSSNSLIRFSTCDPLITIIFSLEAPHSQRETTDETFGSLEYTSEDRAEEERKIRASFELMRKEQYKAFQDKHKLNSDKNNDDFDISSLVEDDEKRLVSRSNESVELHVTLASLSNDEKSSSLSQTPSAARPLVPLALQVQNWNEILQPKHPLAVIQ